MRVGSLVYDTVQGLGVLAKALCDHGVITHPAVVEHGRRPGNKDWYPGAPRVADLRREARFLEDFCATMDVMLFLETPFDWQLIEHCRKFRTKTALMPMYECMPAQLPAVPDVILCPSLLDFQYFLSPLYGPPWGETKSIDGAVPFRVYGGVGGSKAVFTPVSVCADESCPCLHKVRWRRREKAEVFVHNAGHGGLLTRNGTPEVIEAWRFVKSPARLIVRCQWPVPRHDPGLDRRIERQGRTVPFEELYAEGDAFVFPEKFNGLSLPLQEARAAGMLVMGTDRFPMNAWLPREPLVPVARTEKARVGRGRTEFDEAVVEPRAIAAKIDEWYGRDIRAYSESGREWAEENSWARLGPQYRDVLLQLCGN